MNKIKIGLILLSLTLLTGSNLAWAGLLTATPNPASISNTILTVGNTITINTIISGGIPPYAGDWAWSSTNPLNTNIVVNTIQVGKTPDYLAINPAGTLAYVTNYDDNTVSVVNLATNMVINVINVGGRPDGVAFNPQGTLAYVTNSCGNTGYLCSYENNIGPGTVSVINVATNTVGNTITVGGQPYYIGVNPAGTLAYSVNECGNNFVCTVQTTPGTVSIINLATNTISNTITTGLSPETMAFNPSGTRAYVVNWGLSYMPSGVNGSVNVINTANDHIINTITVGNSAAGLAINPTGTLAYVTNYCNTMCQPSISVVNLITDTITNTIMLNGPEMTGGFYVTFNPSGTLAYIPFLLSNTIEVINVATNSTIGYINVQSSNAEFNNMPDCVGQLGNPCIPSASFTINPSGSLGYATNAAENSISSISLSETNIQSIPSNGLLQLTVNAISNNQLSFTVNGITYTQTLPSGQNIYGIYNVYGFAQDNSLIGITPQNTIVVSKAFQISQSLYPSPQVFPSGIRYFIPIMVTNYNPTQSPANFQQMVTFNALAICNAILCAPHLNNTEFFFTNGTLIKSWYESNGLINNYASNTLSTSNNVTAWVLLPPINFIPALGSNTIYLGFASNSINLFSNTVTGEAPALTQIYGKYDNGATVFPLFYDNFAGTTLNAGLWNSYYPQTITVNNGIKIIGTSGVNWNGIISKPAYNPQNTILDTNMYYTTLTTVTDGEIGWDNDGGSGGASPQDFISPDFFAAGYYALGTWNGGSVGYTPTAEASTTSYNIFSIWTSSLAAFGLVNYGNPVSSSANFGSSTSLNLMAQSYTGTDYMQWIRVRALPPSAIMPITTYGLTQSTPTPPPTLTISPNPSYYGQSITLTATCQSGGVCDIDYPTLGTHLATGSGGTATYTYPGDALNIGTYSNYYANDITGLTNSGSQTITIVHRAAIVIPPNIIYYIPITLTNYQSTAVLANTPLSFIFNALAYQSYESTTLNNTELFYANGTIIPSWLEGNYLNEQQSVSTLYASNTIMFWFKSPPTNTFLPASSSATIFMGFASPTTNLWSLTSNVGVAPQLTINYPSVPDVLVEHTNGEVTSYYATSNTDFARGQALLNAMSITNLSNGDKVYLKAETYNINQSYISQGGGLSNIDVYGAGKYETFVTANTEYGPRWIAGYNSITADLNMNGIVWGWSSEYGNSTLRNVYIQGEVDAVYEDAPPLVNNKIFIENDTLTSGYDTINLFNWPGNTIILDSSLLPNMHTIAEENYNVYCKFSGIAYTGSNVTMVNTIIDVTPGLCSSFYHTSGINASLSFHSNTLVKVYGGSITMPPQPTGGGYSESIFVGSPGWPTGENVLVNSTLAYNSLNVAERTPGQIGNVIPDTYGPYNYQKSPQIPPNSGYGQYDDGNNIFGFYDNFAGTTLNPKWTLSAGTYNGINNGAHIGGGIYKNFEIDTGATYLVNPGNITDFYGLVTTYPPDGTSFSVGLDGTYIAYGGESSEWASYTGINFGVTQHSFTSNGVAQFSSDSNYRVYTDAIQTTLSTFSVNYGNTFPSNPSTGNVHYPLPLSILVQTPMTANSIIQWIRVRTQPPSDIMPTAVFGVQPSGSVAAATTQGHFLDFLPTTIPWIGICIVIAGVGLVIGALKFFMGSRGNSDKTTDGR